MISKKYSYSLLFVTVIFSSYLFSNNNEQLNLAWNKEFYRGHLLPSFLKKIDYFFAPKNFIETGTYAGETTAQALLFFENVYTVELDQKMYEQAKYNFRLFPQVAVHHGSSPLFLEQITPTLKGSSLFFLDAHFSGNGTSRDDGETPILRELEAIKKSNCSDAVILIDDIREFGSFIDNKSFQACKGYPSYQEICLALKSINPNFQLYLLGDMLLAYDSTVYVPKVSTLIPAITISRAYTGNSNATDIIEIEKIIGTAQGEERDVIEHVYSDSIKWGYKEFHGYLWYGLICMNEKNYRQAYTEFNRVLDSGYNHWRVHWYKALAALKTGNYDDGKKALQAVVQLNPHFKDAQDLLLEF